LLVLLIDPNSFLSRVVVIQSLPGYQQKERSIEKFQDPYGILALMAAGEMTVDDV